jgi:isochorismate synthase
MKADKSRKSYIIEAVSVCLQNNHTFAAYRLPNQKDTTLIVQKDSYTKKIDSATDFNSIKGFMVAPFTSETCCPRFVIEPDFYYGTDITKHVVDMLKSVKHKKTVTEKPDFPLEVSKEEYLKLLENIIVEIHHGIYEKVVPSRVKIIEGAFISKLGRIFTMLCQRYPNAFVYIFNNSNHLWVGATPEPFLLASNGTMQTVSLAGTRPYTEKNLNIGAWNSKERLEQEYVTRYISGVVSHFNLTQVELMGPYTRKAGNLLHLCTDFSFPSEEIKDRLGQFLDFLHPTPAVCGMPYQLSHNLLLKLEKHNREYYAGYLGPVGVDNNMSLFVNLRCMKVWTDRVALFVGGGITADSVPEDEWQETEIKAETLLSVLRKIK